MNLNAENLNAVETLAHALKYVDRIISDYEEEEYSYRNGRSYGYDDGMGGQYANRGGRMNRDNSYRSGQRRYSRGRYSRDTDMYGELRELMEEAPDEQTRREFEKFIQKMEQM